MHRRIALLVSAVLLVAGMAFAPSAGAMSLGRLIAPPAVCGNQTAVSVPVVEQEQAMRCMTNYARHKVGKSRLGDIGDLDRSAREKSNDILRCDSFSHEACGRQFTYWMERVGYIPARCWRAGENIAWGSGELGSVRATFRAWIHSPEHRANILGDYTQIGIGMERGRLDGHSADVWTQHFGSHCGQPRTSPATPPRAGLADAIQAR